MGSRVSVVPFGGSRSGCWKRTMSQDLSATLRRIYGGAAPQQIDRQPSPTIANLRDRAIVGMLWHANATADAAIAAKVKDYFKLTGRRWLRLRENGAERPFLVPA